MNILGLTPKEFEALAESVDPDGWVLVESPKGGKLKKIASEAQIEAVRNYLEKLYVMDKKRKFLSDMIERLRPEVEKGIGGAR